jgi:hypothetical protein
VVSTWPLVWFGALSTLAGCELLVSIPSASVDHDGSNGASCSSHQVCVAPTPLCDLGAGTCVECLTTADCPIDRPVCAAGTCAPCEDDGECSSGVCLPDGTCADASRVLYTSPTGASATCLVTDPCSLDTAAMIVSATRDIIKLAPGVYDRTANLTPAAACTFSGSGATLRGTATGGFSSLVQVSAVDVTFHRLAFQGSGLIDVQCSSSGKVRFDRADLRGGLVSVLANPCELVAKRSMFADAAYYGVYVGTGPITMSNSFVTHNGTGAIAIAGLYLNNVATGVVESTTIAGNQASMGFGGLSCVSSSAVTINSNIVYGNLPAVIDPTCNVRYSMIDPGYTGPGTNNTVLDPGFVMPGVDYHLSSGSPARGLGDPTSANPIDIDGMSRPQPAGSPPDPGADEVP